MEQIFHLQHPLHRARTWLGLTGLIRAHVSQNNELVIEKELFCHRLPRLVILIWITTKYNQSATKKRRTRSDNSSYRPCREAGKNTQSNSAHITCLAFLRYLNSPSSRAYPGTSNTLLERYRKNGPRVKVKRIKSQTPSATNSPVPQRHLFKSKGIVFNRYVTFE